ncbi:uncharacterized protein [Montipora foliosa]|uniref:uncharacterized protein n=1 Tax=Montipora foliosa TaxID=591990 RepID=UPI0035F18F91
MKRVGFFKNAYRNVRKAYFDRRTTQREFCFETNILSNRRSVQWRTMKFEVRKTALQNKLTLSCFNDESNNEVSEALERGVRATAAFKEANPVLLERAIKTYFKTLKARQKRPTTCIKVEGQIIDKQTKSAVSSRRNQRGP